MQLESMFPGEDGRQFIAILLEGDVAEHTVHMNCSHAGL